MFCKKKPTVAEMEVAKRLSEGFADRERKTAEFNSLSSEALLVRSLEAAELSPNLDLLLKRRFILAARSGDRERRVSCGHVLGPMLVQQGSSLMLHLCLDVWPNMVRFDEATCKWVVGSQPVDFRLI